MQKRRRIEMHESKKEEEKKKEKELKCQSTGSGPTFSINQQEELVVIM